MDYFTARDLMAKRAASIQRTGGILDCNPLYVKKLKNQTYLTYSERDSAGVQWDISMGDAFVIKYFGNAILHFRATFFTIDAHGWFSYSTNERLNEFMPPGFRVWGTTYEWLRERGPLGFIGTPKGVFPYCMPMTFCYDGSVFDGNDPFTPDESMPTYPDDVKAAVEKVPAYVREYLKRLLEGGKPALDNSSAGHPQRLLLTPRYPAELLRRAVADHAQDPMGDLCLGELLEVVLQEGMSVFTASKQRSGELVRLENGIRYKLPIQKVVSGGMVRSTLRPILTEYLVDELKFDRLKWNRR